jgi:hypothetical protein
MMTEKLVKALSELNQWLAARNTPIELQVVGSFAMFLSGSHGIDTQDIDTVTHIEAELYEKIQAIGDKNGLKQNWISDDASDLPLPDGFAIRLAEDRRFSHITIRYASRFDLIQLKAAAFVDRGNEDPKDLDDLVLLSPTKAEIDSAIAFIRKTRTPPQPRFYPNFEEMLDALRTIAKK